MRFFPIPTEKPHLTLEMGCGLYMVLEWLDRRVAKATLVGEVSPGEVLIQGLDEARTKAVETDDGYLLLWFVKGYVVSRNGRPMYVIYQQQYSP
jgi:hypothetical protein